MSQPGSTPAGRIFINYRRQDSAYAAGWLYDRLVERFGRDNIFKDVDSIELGDDFVEVITTAVASCDVLLALIGPDWASMRDAENRRRLDDPHDFVRLEIEAALARDVLLIPVLVEGAQMPRADDLPPSLSPLVRRHALELSPQRFRAESGHLLDVIGEALAARMAASAETGPLEATASAAPAAATTTPAKRSASVRMVGAIGLGFVLVALLVGWGIHALTPARNSADVASPAGSVRAKGPAVVAQGGGSERFAAATLPALTDAARRGASVQSGLRWTKDGVPILIGDRSKAITCEGGDLVVASTSWRTLRDKCRSPAAASLDHRRYPIPTLADALAQLAEIKNAQVYVDLVGRQSAAQISRFLHIVESVRMTDRLVVTSDRPEDLASIRNQAALDGYSLRLMRYVTEQVAPDELQAEGLWAAAVAADVSAPTYTKELNDRGMKVGFWPANSESSWQQANSAGADLLITDRPAACEVWARQWYGD